MLWESLEIENGRLTATDIRTGATAWTSPPDLAIAKYQDLPGDNVLAQTTAEEMILLDRGDGSLKWRSQDDRFAFDSAAPAAAGDFIFAYHGMGNGTNEVLVIDPAGRSRPSRFRLSQQAQALAPLGPTLPDLLLVSTLANIANQGRNFQQRWIQVVDSRGENTHGWRLPRSEDLRDAATSYQFSPIFAEGLILMFNQYSGELLAYEHDPGGGAKKP
jgi:hypothetical protein